MTLESFVASAIMHGTRKRFSTLHAEYLEQKRANRMATPTSSNGLNTSAHSEKSLDRSHIGFPADGRKLNGSGTTGTSINSGVNAAQPSELRPVTVKDVDSKTLEGSHAGDHRAPNTGAGVTDFAKNAPGPRDPARQFKGSKFESDPSPMSTANTEGVGA